MNTDNENHPEVNASSSRYHRALKTLSDAYPGLPVETPIYYYAGWSLGLYMLAHVLGFPEISTSTTESSLGAYAGIGFVIGILHYKLSEWLYDLRSWSSPEADEWHRSYNALREARAIEELSMANEQFKKVIFDLRAHVTFLEDKLEEHQKYS